MSQDQLTPEELTAAAVAAAGPADARAWGEAILAAVERHAHEWERDFDPPKDPGDPLLVHLLRSTAEALNAVPPTPYDGLMEAPAVIAETYQEHAADLSTRKGDYREALHDLVGDLASRIVHDSVPGLTWADLECSGATRERPTPPVPAPSPYDELSRWGP